MIITVAESDVHELIRRASNDAENEICEWKIRRRYMCYAPRGAYVYFYS